ncbi:dephospho-CoA kinase, partial [Neisseria sp. P0021.S007]
PDAAYGIIDVPLLIENPDFLAVVDRVLVIDVSEATQILRVQQRSGLDTEEIKRIMHTQANRKTRLLYADDVLENEGTLSELTKKIQGLHRFYLGYAGNSKFGTLLP